MFYLCFTYIYIYIYIYGPLFFLDKKLQVELIQLKCLPRCSRYGSKMFRKRLPYGSKMSSKRFKDDPPLLVSAWPRLLPIWPPDLIWPPFQQIWWIGGRGSTQNPRGNPVLQRSATHGRHSFAHEPPPEWAQDTPCSPFPVPCYSYGNINSCSFRTVLFLRKYWWWDFQMLLFLREC